MANSTKNVTVGKPKIGGSVFRAPAGTTLPTDATTALAAAFEELGYISDDGVTFSTERESEDIKAWGGDTVLTPQTGFTDSMSLTFIEALRPLVQKTIRGDDNVTGDLANGMTVKVNSTEDTEHVYVIEQVLSNNTLFRTVVPSGKVTELGEVTYADGEAVGYEATISCVPDESGNTHYEYYKTATE